MKKLLAIAALVMLVCLALPAQGFAGGMLEGRVVLGGSFTLDSGEILDGDLLVLGGSVTLREDSLVRGDIVVFGGNVDSNGKIEGNVAVLGGFVHLQSEAVVRGDVNTLGGNIVREEGSRVEGSIRTQTDFDVPFDFRMGEPVFSPLRFWAIATPVRVLWFFFRTFMLGALATLVVMFWEEPTKRVADASIGQTLISGGLGLLTIVLTPAILVILVITILLSPVALLAVIALAVAILFGWIAIGLEVGRRLAEMLTWDLHPAAAAGLGTLLLSLVVGGIGFIPCIGFLAPFLVMMIGLGGVILTRFGTQAYTFAPASAKATKSIEEEAE
jgi:cytoskeletal protein CcmA (bactofilin family)